MYGFEFLDLSSAISGCILPTSKPIDRSGAGFLSQEYLWMLKAGATFDAGDARRYLVVKQNATTTSVENIDRVDGILTMANDVLVTVLTR